VNTQLLKSLRKSVGISQTELALKSKTFQANLSSIENANTDPGLSTIENYLIVLGYSLIPVPTTKPCVADFSITIAEAITAGKDSKAYRLFIQLNDNLTSLEPGLCHALSLTPPPPTGDLRYDALIAALVDFHLSKTSLPVPVWVNEPARKLPAKWIVDLYETSEAKLIKKTPKEFLRRNILIDEAELFSH